MEILLITHQFLPEFSAGTEVLTYETAKELIRRGHNVEVWAGYPAGKELAIQKPVDFYEYEGIKVNRYNHSWEIPLTGQNIMEYEYNNRLFVKYFRKYIANAKPDIVHFFHLSRFSASIIDVCLESAVPMVFTTTDFWIVCPVSQLRLPDNSLCHGPQAFAINCIRHMMNLSQKGVKLRIANKMPDLVFAALVRLAKNTWWPEKRFSPLAVSLSGRAAYLTSHINRLDRVLVPTRFMEKILAQNGFNKDIMTFIPYGLNLKPFENLPPKKTGARLRIGFIGTLAEHKGAHVLLEAIKLMPDESFDVKIYGKFEEIHAQAYTLRLKKLAEGDDRVQFCGTFPNDRIGEIFSGLDVLVVPSIWYENTPLVIYSAHASGTPVIATNLGGMSEVVHHEKNGLLFEKGDANGLASLIKKVCNDRGLLRKFAENITPPQSIAGYVDEVEKVYDDVLARWRKRI